MYYNILIIGYYNILYWEIDKLFIVKINVEILELNDI